MDAFVEFVGRGHREHGIAVGRFVIMPDHLHFFVRGPEDFGLSKWVESLKRNLSKAVRSDGWQGDVWQRGFFDHVLRSSESYAGKWDYVRMNPVRKGLVGDPKEWPYTGEIVVIDRA